MSRPKCSKNKKIKVEEQAKELLNIISELTDSIKSLTLRVEKLENPIPIEEVAKEPTPETPSVPTSQFPVPQEYREIVNNYLNSQFGIEINYFSDRPEFSFTIVVPEKYSNMSPEEKEVKKVDLRTKIITNAEGLNGVRDWTERVYKNFNPEIQAQIVADRPSAQ